MVGNPVLDKIDLLLDSGNTWDSITRNDFCRYGRPSCWCVQCLLLSQVHACHTVNMGWSCLFHARTIQGPGDHVLL